MLNGLCLSPVSMALCRIGVDRVMPDCGAQQATTMGSRYRGKRERSPACLRIELPAFTTTPSGLDCAHLQLHWTAPKFKFSVKLESHPMNGKNAKSVKKVPNGGFPALAWQSQAGGYRVTDFASPQRFPLASQNCAKIGLNYWVLVIACGGMFPYRFSSGS